MGTQVINIFHLSHRAKLLNNSRVIVAQLMDIFYLSHLHQQGIRVYLNYVNPEEPLTQFSYIYKTKILNASKQ
jgi:hypothetical protein